MLRIDLTGKRALVAGVADDGGFGFAIAKAFAEAGATVSVATWPPALGIFRTMLERGKLDASLVLRDGSKMSFAKIYPLDAEFDRLDDVPAELRDSRRYRDLGDFTIGGLAAAVAGDGGVDIVVHSLANGSEVKKPLLETSRKGYLGAVSASAIGFIDKMIDYTTKNTPLPEPITAADVGNTAAFLCSPLAAGITGATIYVDKGYAAMGVAPAALG